jgi:hypothetical protein
MDDETEDGSRPGSYRMSMPFWIDTDAYSDRDREMFVAGVEFEMIYCQLEAGGPFKRTIHRENESRTRMMCGRLGRRCSIEACPESDDPDGHWSFLSVKE